MIKIILMAVIICSLIFMFRLIFEKLIFIKSNNQPRVSKNNVGN